MGHDRTSSIYPLPCITVSNLMLSGANINRYRASVMTLLTYLLLFFIIEKRQLVTSLGQCIIIRSQRIRGTSRN